MYRHTEEEAEVRAKDRDNQWVLKCLADEPRPSDQQLMAVEQAYRRGFQQGAHAAYEALAEEGFSESQVEDWIYESLQEWRYGVTLKNVAMPPEVE